MHDGGCPLGTEPVFSNEWEGTGHGCWIRDGASCGEDCEIKVGYIKARSPEKHDYCPFNGAKLQPIQSVDMSVINGKIICGVRDGASFENVIRPDISDGKCPDGT